MQNFSENEKTVCVNFFSEVRRVCMDSMPVTFGEAEDHVRGHSAHRHLVDINRTT